MSYEKYKDFRLAPDDNGCWSVLTADTYEGRGTFPSKAAAKRFIDENTPPSTPPEEVELENLLNNLADEIMTEFDHTNCQPELQRAKAKLLRWREAYADKARIDELERLYLVYGSKEKPASLDNLFSLGKKGEVCATPIKDRLSALRKQQGDT